MCVSLLKLRFIHLLYSCLSSHKPIPSNSLSVLRWVINPVEFVSVSVVIALGVFVLWHSAEPLDVLAEIRVTFHFLREVVGNCYTFWITTGLVEFVEVKFLSLPFFNIIKFAYTAQKLLLLILRHFLNNMSRNVCSTNRLLCRSLLYRSLKGPILLSDIFLSLAVRVDFVIKLAISRHLIVWSKRINISLGIWCFFQRARKSSFNIINLVCLGKVFSCQSLPKDSLLVLCTCLSTRNVLSIKTCTGYKVRITLGLTKNCRFTSFDFSNRDKLSICISALITRIEWVTNPRRNELCLSDI